MLGLGLGLVGIEQTCDGHEDGDTLDTTAGKNGLASRVQDDDLLALRTNHKTANTLG